MNLNEICRLPNILIIILLIYLFRDLIKQKCYEFFDTIVITTDTDKNSYKVVKRYNDSKEAAEIIAKINIFSTEFIKRLKSVYIDKTLNQFINETVGEYSTDNEAKYLLYSKQYKKGNDMANILLKRYTHKSLSENEPIDLTKTSYTENKGEVISLCLREKDSGRSEFHPIEIIQFVMLHELSHIVTPTLDHSNLFWTNFKFILEFCKWQKLYISPDFANNNYRYCGMEVAHSPAYDDKLRSYFKMEDSLVHI